MPRITLVKKIKSDGTPCRKCVDVVERLEREGLMDRIDRVVVADERLADSEGARLAVRHQVDRAPFFVVEDKSGDVRVYTVYYRFLNDVLRRQADERDELTEMIEQNPDLDFI